MPGCIKVVEVIVSGGLVPYILIKARLILSLLIKSLLIRILNHLILELIDHHVVLIFVMLIHVLW